MNQDSQNQKAYEKPMAEIFFFSANEPILQSGTANTGGRFDSPTNTDDWNE